MEGAGGRRYRYGCAWRWVEEKVGSKVGSVFGWCWTSTLVAVKDGSALPDKGSVGQRVGLGSAWMDLLHGEFAFQVDVSAASRVRLPYSWGTVAIRGPEWNEPGSFV